jgi:hypothetical protein
MKIHNLDIFYEGLNARSEDDKDHELLENSFCPYNRDTEDYADWYKGYFWIDKKETLELYIKDDIRL